MVGISRWTTRGRETGGTGRYGTGQSRTRYVLGGGGVRKRFIVLRLYSSFYSMIKWHEMVWDSME